MAGPDKGTPPPDTNSGSDVPGPVFDSSGRDAQGHGDPGVSRTSESENPMQHNAPGYVPQGQGIDELDPDGDGALRPGRVATVMESRDERMSAGDGGFKLDPEAMHALLPRWRDVRDRLRKLRADGQQLVDVTKPADDDASTMQIEAAGKHQQTYATIIEQQYTYAEAYVDALEQAIAKVEEADRAAETATHNVGREL